MCVRRWAFLHVMHLPFLHLSPFAFLEFLVLTVILKVYVKAIVLYRYWLLVDQILWWCVFREPIVIAVEFMNTSAWQCVKELTIVNYEIYALFVVFTTMNRVETCYVLDVLTLVTICFLEILVLTVFLRCMWKRLFLIADYQLWILCWFALLESQYNVVINISCWK